MIKLGELIGVKHGFAFKSEHFAEQGDYILLTPGNFEEQGGLKLKGEKEKFYSGAFPAEYLLRKGDLLLAMTDLTQNAPILGSPAFIPEDDRFLHNQRLGKVINLKPDQIDLGFLFYLFNTASVRGQIKGSASGATVRHTAPSRICDVTAAIPPLAVQRRIARTLANYDELIENNQRRIRILEEMARALYREWFVEFRFPGHMTSQWVSSSLGDIPAGWTVRKLGEILELQYGRALKQEVRREGAVAVYGSSGIVGMHDTALVSGPGIVVGRKGNVGSVFWSDDSFYPIDTVYFVVSKLPLRFLYHDLLSKTFLNSDAAVPGLNRTQAYSMETVVPPPELLSRFTSIANDIGKQASLLHAQCRKLRAIRDLLLPHLMKG